MSDKNLNHFVNNLNSNWDPKDDKSFDEFLVNKIVTLSDQIWNNVGANHDFKEDNLYSGSVGIAFMFWHLSQKTFLSDFQRNLCLSRARTLISQSLNAMVEHRIERSHSFLFGNSGICLTAGLIFNSCEDYKSRDHYLNLFIKFSPFYVTIDLSDKSRDTLFEGRAGFICAALLANSHFKSHIISVQIIQNIGISVIKSGKFDALMTESNLPLIYETKKGLAFELCGGMAGILLSLLCIPDLTRLHPDFEPDIKSVVDYILSKQCSNGSFISDELNSDSVDWCSGSSGVSYLMAKAYQLWSDHKYKNSLIKFGEFLWNKGLTRNGPGVGTGIAGNGFTFLLLFRLTNDQKYLIRAKRFAQFILEDNYLKQNSCLQNPNSLFEGWAGVVSYLSELLNPKSAQMPLFFNIFNKEKTELTEDFASFSESSQEINLINSIELSHKRQKKSSVEQIKH